MRIAFITNYEKTIFFHGIAKRLAVAGHDVAWISPSAHWARWLADQGVAASQILDVTRYGPEWRRGRISDADRQRLASLEARGGLRVNNLILMDRLLRTRPIDQVRAYLSVASREVAAFLAERRIEVVFGEQTFGIELLVGLTCRAHDRELLAPHTVRIPSGRLGFFRGHLQEELAEIRPVTEHDRATARDYVAEFRRTRPRPEYFNRRNKPPLPRAGWPAKLRKHVRLELADPYDETHFSPAWLVRKRASEVINAISHRLGRSFWVPPEAPERPFVLFPLHRQPESSVDVIASRMSNQLELVRALARTLPATHDLYVKEHPNGLGDRTRGELRALRQVPGVKLIDPAVSSFALVDRADLLITISGTAAYEAALLRRPAVAVTNMFFGPILAVNNFNPYADSVADLLAHHTLADDQAIVELVARVLARSFSGHQDNPLFTPSVLDPHNLEAVARGFSDLLANGRPRWA